MIVFRYLAREVFFTMLVVAMVLLAISMGGRIIAYLQDAATGLINSDVVFSLIALRLPDLLEIILPVSFFLGIMLGYGRLYLDSEMVVLEACGMSPQRLIWTTLSFSLFVAVAVASMSLWIRPWAHTEIGKIREAQENLTEFDLLRPGQFQTMSDGQRVTYTEELDQAGPQMNNVFVVNHLADDQSNRKADVILAEKGQQSVKPNGDRFLVFLNGTRSTGVPGDAKYRLVEYEEYGQLLERKQKKRAQRRAAIPTRDLLEDGSLWKLSEFQWRVSIIVLVPIAALMAVPLCQVNPRKGRFAHLIPGMILIFLYLVLLSVSRNAVEKAQIPLNVGLWWVHLLYVVIVILLFKARPLLLDMGWRKPGTSTPST
jgi:lipopolysaccharide export system permease protein|tara:strand:- start:3802 stop:4914 length:1113 start_codon:yes stop_codon:yes gene_type:complete